MDKIVLTHNFNQCRTCLNRGHNLQSLEEMTQIETAQNISYAFVLNEVAKINVSLDEDMRNEMPHSICNCCIQKLKSAYAFIRLAKNANEQLCSLHSHNQSLDCLQESEIDINACLEIKLENEKAAISEESKHEHDNAPTPESIHGQQVHAIQTSEENELQLQLDLHCGPYQDSDSSEEQLDDEPFQDALPNDYEEPAKTYKKKHITKDEDNIAVPCLKCNKIFNNSKELTRHLRNTHLPEDQKCACPLCGIKFTRPCNMYKHMRTLHDPEQVRPLLPGKEKPFQCEKCPRRYTQKRQLNCHIKDKHKNGEESKNESFKSTPSDTKKKSEVRPLCFVCGSSFSNKAHLIVHMTRHTGEKPFQCDLCDRAFPRISDLTCHRRIHTGEKPFKCKLCEKAFRVSTKLATHMRSHTNERPYKCKQCERTFKYSKDLNIHNRVHTGERPYCCTVCGSTFTQSNSLKAHRTKLGHMDEEPSSLMHFIS